MSKPVAVIALDIRAWGPASCERCERDVEEVLLMDDATFVCPECGTLVQGFEDITALFTSAAPVKPGEFTNIG